MHSGVSLSAISTLSWSLEHDLAFWARSDITNVGVSVAKLEAHGWEKGVARIREADLSVTNLIGLGGADLANPSTWPEAQARLIRVVETAPELDAGCVVLTTGRAAPLSWDDAVAALTTFWAPVLTVARMKDVTLVLEHTNQLRTDVSFVHTLRDACDLAEHFGIGVCVEFQACWAERGVESTIGEHIERLRLIQVSDGLVGTRCTPDRLVPGDGELPLERLMRVALDAGYPGMFDIEILGPRIEAEGAGAACLRAIEWLDTTLERVGA